MDSPERELNDPKPGETVYEDATGLFRIVYDPSDSRHNRREYVVFMRYRDRWCRVGRGVSFQPLVDGIERVKRAIKNEEQA